MPYKFKDVLDTIETEGFEYTFVHYDTFEDVEDEKFQDLRENYLIARQQFADYIGYDD